jgi:hypothetical protein
MVSNDSSRRRSRRPHMTRQYPQVIVSDVVDEADYTSDVLDKQGPGVRPSSKVPDGEDKSV